jgi:hypothetical protein
MHSEVRRIMSEPFPRFGAGKNIALVKNPGRIGVALPVAA